MKLKVENLKLIFIVFHWFVGKNLNFTKSFALNRTNSIFGTKNWKRKWIFLWFSTVKKNIEPSKTLKRRAAPIRFVWFRIKSCWNDSPSLRLKTKHDNVVFRFSFLFQFDLRSSSIAFCFCLSLDVGEGSIVVLGGSTGKGISSKPLGNVGKMSSPNWPIGTWEIR